MKQIREVIEVLGGPYEVIGAAITGVGACVMVILTSAIFG